MQTPRPAPRRDAIYSLFDRGYIPTSPEVKKLGMKLKTRHAYYAGWKQTRGIKPTSLPGGETVMVEKAVPEPRAAQAEPEPEENEPETVVRQPGAVPGDQHPYSVKDEEEDDEDHDGQGETSTVGNAKISVIRDAPLTKTKSLKESIAGEGLIIQAKISSKTLALYEIARTQSRLVDGEELSMGDFIDTCVEDFYIGRGLDLGLIKVGGNGSG
jgi:hypothetical protein